MTAGDQSKLSTGLPNLDRVLRGLLPGDNVAWQIASVAQYRPLVTPFCERARKTGRHLVYFRFAGDEPLAPEGAAETHRLELGRGFEPIITQIQNVIEEAGPGAYYVFDCLSDLAVGCYSDRMLGNFIMLICPYIWEHQGIAYFPLFRGAHSYHAAHLIADTVQVMIDVYDHDGITYLLPHKVERRYSNTMFMLHAWEGDEFRPVADSSVNTRVLSGAPWRRQEGPTQQLGFWARTFAGAEQVPRALDRSEPPPEDVQPLLDQLLRMMIRSEGRILELARKHLGLSDLVAVRRRMIGAGPLGGKSVGMLLARSMLRQADPLWDTLLEPHDSFYIGADVFYTYLVQNGLWWIKQKQKDPATFLEGLAVARLQIRNGAFPDYIMEQFGDLLDYFGQSPIIVRSSSLLEDSYETSFAGKATSFFCFNQGSRDERLTAFVSAVKAVYASGMSEQALKYRSAHGLLGRDEQMSILVQRVSGKAHGRWFFPDVAGVGLSYNPYVWNADIEAGAGVVRLVLGLGTRAVGPSDRDFARLIALNAPDRQPLRTSEDAKKWAQRNEVMRFCQSFMTELYRHIGPSRGVPAGDLGVGAREISFLFGQYKRIQNEFSGALTGKSPDWGGSLIRPEATGYGVVYFAREMLKTRDESLENKVCTISGSGNAAQYTAEKLIELGAKVVSLSDSDGAIYDKAGIDADKLNYVMELKNVARGRIKEYADKYPGVEYREKTRPWSIKRDCAFPCATENEIDGGDAMSLVANGCFLVAEGANMPTDDGGIDVFRENNVLFGPGKAANAGGVAVSGLEMAQNAQHLSWPREEVDGRLQQIMRAIHTLAWEMAEEYGMKGDLMAGANIAGFVKTANAMLHQGLV